MVPSRPPGSKSTPKPVNQPMPLHPAKDVSGKSSLPPNPLADTLSPVQKMFVQPTPHIPPDPALVKQRRFRKPDFKQQPLDNLLNGDDPALHPVRKFLADFLAEDFDEIINIPRLSIVLRRAFEIHGIEGARRVATYLQERSRRVRNIVGVQMEKLEAHARVIESELANDAKVAAEQESQKNGAA